MGLRAPSDKESGGIRNWKQPYAAIIRRNWSSPTCLWRMFQRIRTLICRPGMWFPVVVVKNVYIFPGVPEILQRKFTKIREMFREAPYHLVEVYLQADEGQIARILHFILEKFPDLQLGSYPYFTKPDYSIKLTLESKDTDYLAGAHSLLLSELSRIDLQPVQPA